MKIVKANKVVNAALLADELQTAFPALAFGTTLTVRTWMANNPDGHVAGDIEVVVSDATTDASVLAVISAHDAAKKSSGQLLDDKRATFIAAYKTTVFYGKSTAEIDALIDTTYSTLTNAQRVGLKDLAKVAMAAALLLGAG